VDAAIDVSVNPARLLSRKQAALLAALILALAAVALWVLQPLAFLPWSGTVHPSLLPQVLTGALLGGVALLAPFLIESSSAQALSSRIGRAAYIALWIGVMELFALLVSSRLVPLETLVILAVTACLGALAFGFQMAAAAFPGVYTGGVFLWLIGLPVLAYFTAEIAMMIPAHAAWGSENSGVYAIVRSMLNLSPSTFVIALLNGVQADGSEVSWWLPLAGIATMVAVSILVLARQKLRIEQSSEVHSVQS